MVHTDEGSGGTERARRAGSRSTSGATLARAGSGAPTARVDAGEVGRGDVPAAGPREARHHGRPHRHASAPAGPACIGVVVADRLAVMRAAVRIVLERAGGFEVWEAATQAELAEIVERERPHIALVDVELPPLGGIAAVERLMDRYETRGVVWGFAPEPGSVLAAVRGNACGFIKKTVPPAALVRALRGVAQGEACLSRCLTSALIDELNALARRERSRRRTAALTSREWSVLGLVADGYGNRQVAAALRISEFTVKRHIHNILEKLDVDSRRAAAALYREASEAEYTLKALETA